MRQLVLVAALSTILLLAAPVHAAKPDCDPASNGYTPNHPSCTTTEDPQPLSCQQRVDNGATGWNLGTYQDGSYTASGLGACIDIRPEHVGVIDWDVTWAGEATRKIKGLKLVFEQGVHGTIYATHTTTLQTGTWQATLEPAEQPLVFVAMPHTSDKWQTFRIKLTPRDT